MGRSPLLTLAVGFVLLYAGVMRFWGLGAGIPEALGIDEPQIMSRSVAMMRSGDLNPHFFDYPGLYIHLQFGLACIHFLFGAMRGWWDSLEHVGMEDFVLWGRTVTALLGVVTVFLVYRCGTRWGTSQAIVAAALMAAMPSHIRESHYILTDVPMTFFVALTLLLTFRASELNTFAAFAWAGAAAGLATATKYNGCVSVILPVLAASFASGTIGRRAQLAGTAASACLLVFILAAPYTILDLPGFLNGFARLADAVGPHGDSTLASLEIYLKHLRINMGTPASVLAIAGLGWSVISARPDRRLHAALVTLFPIAYIWFISSKTLIFARYILPALPFLCLLVSFAIVEIALLVNRFVPLPVLRPILIVGLVGLAMLPPARQAIAFDRLITTIGTQRLAYEWIDAHIPKGSEVAIEASALMLPSPQYSVHQVRRAIDARSLAVVTCSRYLIVSSAAYGDVLSDPKNHGVDHAAYMDLLQRRVELASFRPSAQHPGPELKILERQPSSEDATGCR